MPDTVPDAAPAPSLARLTNVFLRVGNTTFGGGTPTIAALQREFVDRQKWLSREDYALAFSLARVTPGTSVIAFCAAAGARILGFRGALVGALAETLPSAVLAVLLTQGYESWRGNGWVMAGVGGTIAAVAGMMWSSVWSLVRPYCKSLGQGAHALVIAGGAFAALRFFGLSPLPIIIGAALLGAFWKEPEKP